MREQIEVWNLLLAAISKCLTERNLKRLRHRSKCLSQNISSLALASVCTCLTVFDWVVKRCDLEGMWQKTSKTTAADFCKSVLLRYRSLKKIWIRLCLTGWKSCCERCGEVWDWLEQNFLIHERKTVRSVREEQQTTKIGLHGRDVWVYKCEEESVLFLLWESCNICRWSDFYSRTERWV